MIWLILLGLLLVVAICLSVTGSHHKKIVSRGGRFLSKAFHYRRVISYRGRLLSQINRVRRRNGLAPLGRVRFLDKVAKGHSERMAKNGTCSHHAINYRRNLIQRKAGLIYVGENCYKFPARRYDRHVAEKMARGWLQSPGHRANILNPNYRRTGIGIAVSKGYIYATQIFTE